MMRNVLSRRAVLRGAGVALALPLLEAMQPARADAPAGKPPRRLVFIYASTGVAVPLQPRPEKTPAPIANGWASPGAWPGNPIWWHARKRARCCPIPTS